jgi:hypothetical protein
MGKIRGLFLLLFVLGALLQVSGCRSRKTPPPAPPPSVLESMTLLDTGEERLRVGSPQHFGNLALYPIFSSSQKDVGPVLSLDTALTRKVAEVRELGEGENEGSNARQPGRHAQHASGPTVGKLVIENRGDIPVFVLAGTVVKGGNQDRQIAQDFIVAAKSTVPVDAFCVEQGRWAEQRNGVSTQGKFSVLDQLATTKVRAAGQHEGNQGQVWSEVAKVNAAHGKNAPSGSLMASMDDKDVIRKRSALAKRITDKLTAAEPNAALVGFAYAVNSRVKGVRWFSSNALFKTFRGVLANTAASDAITLEGQPAQGSNPGPEAIVRFVTEIEKTPAQERATPAENANDYKSAPSGYSAKTKLRAGKSAPAVPVSKDFVAK